MEVDSNKQLISEKGKIDYSDLDSILAHYSDCI